MSQKSGRNKWPISLYLALAILALPLLVQAGGWAVLTLETWPSAVMAEQPVTIEFAVRQHGSHLLSGLSPVVTAIHPATGDKMTFNAVATDDEGHYQAELTLPHAGQWQWHIDAFGYDHRMPPLQVSPYEAAPASGSGTNLPALIPLAIGITSLAATFVALLAWWQQRTRLRLAFSALTALIALLALGLSWGSDTAVAEQPQPATPPTAEMGPILFVAKGCITCHQHDGITLAPNFAPIGPDLTHYVGDPTYLQSWLKDPPALKPQTQMPNLALSDTEIQTLTTFLSQK